MMKCSYFLLLIGVFVARSAAQWPLGQGFYVGMNNMVNGLNNMAQNMRLAGEQMAIQRQVLINDDMRRAWEGVPFGDGGSVFITASGGLGYAYNSTDGSYTLYSLGSGSPPSGYMYHVNAQGGTSFHNW